MPNLNVRTLTRPWQLILCGRSALDQVLRLRLRYWQPVVAETKDVGLGANRFEQRARTCG